MKACFLLVSVLMISLVFSRTTWDQLENYTFESYVKEFNKIYSSEQEFQSRRNLFDQRLKEIKIHNAGDAPWKEGVNHLTDRTEEEIGKLFGYQNSNWRNSIYRNTGYNTHLLQNVASFEPPTSFDWRSKNVITAVKDQGNCGSCWVFAATEAIESAYAIKHGEGLLTDLSVQQGLDCTPNPNDCGGSGGCGGGTCELIFESHMRMGGSTTEWMYPYTSYYGRDYACHYNSSITVPYAQVKNYTKLPSNQYQPIMDALVQNGPIGVIVDAGTFFKYESGIFAGCSSTEVTLQHAVLIVGYGHDESTGLDFWTLRNQWTPTWGEEGYIRIRRDSGKNITCAIDKHPQSGTGCNNGPSQVTCCGMCGMYYDCSLPIIE